MQPGPAQGSHVTCRKSCDMQGCARKSTSICMRGPWQDVHPSAARQRPRHEGCRCMSASWAQRWGHSCVCNHGRQSTTVLASTSPHPAVRLLRSIAAHVCVLMTALPQAIVRNAALCAQHNPLLWWRRQAVRCLRPSSPGLLRNCTHTPCVRQIGPQIGKFTKYKYSY